LLGFALIETPAKLISVSGFSWVSLTRNLLTTTTDRN
jgi:hypothetical protein